MAQTLGIDFSLARPLPRAVLDAGYIFVMGYVSHSPGKNLTAAQVAAYRSVGLGVGLVWETTADRALSGGAGGAADARDAASQAAAIGYPPSCVMFGAVDFGASVAQIEGPIRDYFTAFDADMPHPAGVYGSFDVVSRLCTPGHRPVAYAWQTMAWSRAPDGTWLLWQPGHLYQRLSHAHNIAGMAITDWDENVLLNRLPLFGWTPLPIPEDDMDAVQDERLRNIELMLGAQNATKLTTPMRVEDTIGFRVRDIQDRLVNGPAVDVDGLAARIVAGLAGQTTITVTDVQEAVRSVLREGVGA